SLPANARPCAVALRYLAAVDLDRAAKACSLLDGPTLAAAGGMLACERLLLQARGVRIRYSITDASPSSLGTTIRFVTHSRGGVPLRQRLLASPSGVSLPVFPEWW